MAGFFIGPHPHTTHKSHKPPPRRSADLLLRSATEYLIRTDLRGANLTSADLRGANLSDADLSYANLGDANLSDADLADVIWPAD